MINRALFKQSCKANWVKWLSVTVATCAMLAIVIVVLGSLSINDIRNSLKEVFTQADQQAELKEDIIDSYDLYLTTVEQSHQIVLEVGKIFDEYEDAKAQVPGVSEEQKAAIREEIASKAAAKFAPMLEGTMFNETVLKMALTNFLKQADADRDAAQASLTLLIKQQLKNILPGQIAEAAKEQKLSEGATEEEAALAAEQAGALATAAVEDYVTQTASAAYDLSLFEQNAKAQVNQMMYDQVFNMQIEQNVEEKDAKLNAVAVKVISDNAISTYQIWQEAYSEDGVLTSDEKTTARAEATKSISDQIPENVGVALEELGDMDVYGLIIGSIFYRIAGLLLPMVFVIMTANGLLAGQVDSGSMAYVLSTPTKRRTVCVTQMAYLLFSLFAMFALLTVVSVISVWAVGGNNFAINFAEILQFNLGAFLTMFAIAGFCFMCSAIFNRTKYSLSIGGGLTIFSLVCTILGLFGSNVVPSAMRITQMNFFNYLSVITLFDTTDILMGSMAWLWKFGILLGIGIVTFIVGIFRFDKKDLPL